MGLFDLLKQALSSEDQPVTPSVAAITIISSAPATQTSESQSSQARG